MDALSLPQEYSAILTYLSFVASTHEASQLPRENKCPWDREIRFLQEGIWNIFNKEVSTGR